MTIFIEDFNTRRGNVIKNVKYNYIQYKMSWSMKTGNIRGKSEQPRRKTLQSQHVHT